MTRRRRPHIPLRQPIYVGCEGASEAGYAALLRDMATDAGGHVHLHIDKLGPGAGDPLARIEMAVHRIERLRRTRAAFVSRFAFLDEDQAEREPARANRARSLAEENDITIIWQRSCFEAVLLRHFPERATHRPPTSQDALRALMREWPDYKKPLDRAALARRIDVNSVLRAAAVELDLAVLLRVLGLLA